MSVTAVPIPPIRRGVLGMLWAGVAVAAVGAVALAFVGAAPVVAMKGSAEQFLAYNRSVAGVSETPGGVQYQVVKKGEGDATPGETDIVNVMLVARLRDGTVVQATQQPQVLPLGAGMPKALTEALRLMPKKSHYRFWMTPEQVFGTASPDPAKIPPGSVLILDAQMVDFISRQQFQQLQMQQQLQQQMAPQGMPSAPGAGLDAAPAGH